MWQKLFIAGVLAMAIGGCRLIEDRVENSEGRDYFDPAAKLTREDFGTLAPYGQHPETAKARDGGAPPIPEMSQILAAPRPAHQAQEQVVSISVTEDIPLKDVFMELARLANLDLDLDTQISGGIIFRAKDKPLKDVVRRICESAGLKYEFDDGALKITRDMPYLVNYTLDFLNLDRNSKGGMAINTNVLSAGQGEGGGGDSLNTGSNVSIESKTESDLWKNFEEAVKQILTAMGKKKSADAAADEDQDGIPDSFYVLNKEGGLMTVFGTQVQQNKVRNYIDNLRAKSAAQVLIEAKIVEVTLNDEFSSGIDWGSISFNKPLDFEFSVNGRDPTADALVLSFSGDGGNPLEAALELAQTFGTTRTLSSPRVHAINNQQAVLTFAENEVYFDISIERESDSSSSGSSTNLVTVDSEIKTVPIGIIVTVQPSINEETGEITMNVRPTLSRVVSRVADPSIPIAIAQINNTASGGSGGLNIDPDSLNNEIPVVEVREIDTIMKMKNGEVLVMGGLMEERSVNTDAGVPFASDIPFVGNLFKNVSKDKEVVEMVIFIKATIVPSSGLVTKQDIDFYKKFTTDPRPLAF